MITDSDMEKILDLLVTAYGEKSYGLDDVRKMAKIKNLWSVMFADDEPIEVLTAVKDCIATLQFAPKIADIKSRIAQNRLSGQLTEAEVWELIRKAVENSTSREEAKKIFDGLPKIVQDVARTPSQLRAWRTVSDEQFETVIMSFVSRNYRTVANRIAGYHALPSDVQQVEAWKIDGAPKPEALPAPEKPKYELPAEWNRNRPVDDSVIDRLSDFTKGEEK